MQRLKKTAAIALMCVPALVITGCTKAVSGTATAAAVAEPSSAESTSSSTSKSSPKTTTESTTTESTPTPDDTAKPSQEAVYNAVVKILTDNGAPQAAAEQAADCMVPKMMEQLSAAALNALVENGEDAVSSTADLNALQSIISECVPGA